MFATNQNKHSKTFANPTMVWKTPGFQIGLWVAHDQVGQDSDTEPQEKDIRVCHPDLNGLCVFSHSIMDCNCPGSSVRGLLQARIVGRVAISFSRGSSEPAD